MNAPIVYLSGLSMFLALVTFFYNKGYQGANRFLAAFLFLSALYFLIQFVFIYSNSLVWMAFFSSGFASLYYLIGPLGFFYVRSVLRDSARISGWDYVHFVPFLVVFSGIIPYIFSSWDHKLELAHAIMQNEWKQINALRPHLWFTSSQNEFLRLIQSLFYGIAWWVHFLKNRTNRLAQHPHQYHLIKRWLFLFCALYSLLIVFRLWFGVAQIFSPDRATIMPLIHYTNLIASLVFLTLNVCLFLFPQILYGLPAYQVSYRPLTSTAPSGTSTRFPGAEPVESDPKGEELAQFFSAEYLKNITTVLAEWVSQQRFLESESTMAQLSLQTGIPQHHLSYYFNNISPHKFTDWRNQLKVDCAKQLMQQGFADKSTLDALALEAGFNSRATFFRVFKKMEGMTPAEFNRLRRQGNHFTA